MLNFGIIWRKWDWSILKNSGPKIWTKIGKNIRPACWELTGRGSWVPKLQTDKYNMRYQVQILPCVLLARCKIYAVRVERYCTQAQGNIWGIDDSNGTACAAPKPRQYRPCFILALPRHSPVGRATVLGRRRRASFFRSFYHTRARLLFFLGVRQRHKGGITRCWLRATRSFLFNLEPSTLMEVLFAIG